MHCKLYWLALGVTLSCTGERSEHHAASAASVARPVVPPALARAIVFLDSALPPATKDRLRHALPDSSIYYHMSLGMWLRNEAGLWRGGEIADSMRAHGVRHPDDMSDVILRAYGFYLRGKPINLDSLLGRVPPPPTGFELLGPPHRGAATKGSRAAP